MSKETKQIVTKEIRKLRAKANRKRYEAEVADKKADQLAVENNVLEQDYNINV